jgi:predicted negative regulator of RcsB-dependent stress response
MAKGKKISRKELLKKPDEFITLSTRIIIWVKENVQKVIWIGSGAILVLVVYFGYTAYQNRQERLAHEKYFSSLELTDTEKKIKMLEEVINEFPRTKGASDSLVTAGHLYYQKKNFTRAVASYQAALAKGNFPPVFKFLISENLAYALEQKGDLQQAAKTFSEIAQGKENFLKEDVLLSLARIYEKLKKPQEAKSTYQTFLQSFPKSIYASMVKERLAGL